MAYRIAARNQETGQAVYQQFLDGSHIEDPEQARLHAESFAQRQSQRTGQTWLPEIDQYTPGKKFSLR